MPFALNWRRSNKGHKNTMQMRNLSKYARHFKRQDATMKLTSSAVVILYLQVILTVVVVIVVVTTTTATTGTTYRETLRLWPLALQQVVGLFLKQAEREHQRKDSISFDFCGVPQRGGRIKVRHKQVPCVLRGSPFSACLALLLDSARHADCVL